MRFLLLAAVLAVAGMASLLFLDGSKRHQPATRESAAPEQPRTGPAEAGPLPAAEEDREGFLAECKRRGAGAVPRLLELLRSGADRRLAPRWVFAGGKLQGYPTLRSVYIEALIRNAGPEAAAALNEVLRATGSVQESYVIAQALHARGERDWIGPALERCGGNAVPTVRALKTSMLALAARADPDATAAHLVKTAPRGNSHEAPRVLATGLTALPLDHATSTAGRLLADGEVTAQAKGLYMRALCARPEVEAVRLLTAMMERRELDRPMRIEGAYAAAGAGGFRLDVIAHRVAVAKGDADAAARARERFERRMSEVVRLIQVAFRFDVRTSDDKRAMALRRLLEQHKKDLGTR